MMESPAPPELDARLRPLLEARSPSEARAQLERLVAELEPVIRGVIRRKLRVGAGAAKTESQEQQTAEDLRGEVVLHLLARLQELRAAPGDAAIGSLRSFAAVTAYRVCDTYLRRKYPCRASLKNRLLYLLTRQSGQTGLAAWDGPDGSRLCGFAAWRDRPADPRSSRRRELLENPVRVMAAALPGEDPAAMNPAALVAALFDRAGGPLELDELVGAMARLWGVVDPVQAAPAGEEEDPDPFARLEDPKQDTAAAVERRAFLRALWAEIRQLPPRQCAALLLNLRDGEGRGVIALLPIGGVATIREMAAAMEMPAEQFAALWNELPVEDARIAALLGCTRQQVINLRKVARERLARRMRAADG